MPTDPPSRRHALRLLLLAAGLPLLPSPAQAAEPTLSVQLPVLAGDKVVIGYSGMPGDGSDWITIVTWGTPDSRWGDYAYTPGGSEGRVTLPAQPPGQYEIRAYIESPRRLLARLRVDVVATGAPTLTLETTTFKANQPIPVRFANMPGHRSDWITVIAKGALETEWGAWQYTGGGRDGELVLTGQRAGEYEVRAYAERPWRTIVARVFITIVP